MAQQYPVSREAAPPRAGSDGSQSIPDLFKELRDEALLLVRQEVALAKTEMSEKIARLLRNLGYIVAGLLVVFIGAVLILEAISALVAIGLVDAGLKEQAPWLAPLIVGVVVVLIGAIAAMKGANTVKNESLKPEQTIDSLKKDKQWIENKTK
ncbi:phage holin family protein [soil metagenome]